MSNNGYTPMPDPPAKPPFDPDAAPPTNNPPAAMRAAAGGPLRLADVQDLAHPPAQEDEAEIEVTLAQIIGRTMNLPTKLSTETKLKVSPVNMKGFAAIERAFGSFDDIDKHLDPEVSHEAAGNLLKFITILVNQDKPEGMELAEEYVGRMIDADKLPLIYRIIGEMTLPLRVAAAHRMAVKAAAKEAAEKAQAGNGSSSSSPSTSPPSPTQPS